MVEKVRGKWRAWPAWARIASQFVAELLLPLPFVLIVMGLKHEWTVASFMATYTAIGFAAAAFLRIQKHHRQDNTMQAMRTMLQKLDAATETLVGHATGGNTAPRLEAQGSGAHITFMVNNPDDRFPIYQISGFVTQVEFWDPHTVRGDPTKDFNVDLVLPGHSRSIAHFENTGLEWRGGIRYSVNVQTRTGAYKWRVAAVWFNNRAQHAIAYRNPDRGWTFDVPPGFPNQYGGGDAALFGLDEKH